MCSLTHFGLSLALKTIYGTLAIEAKKHYLLQWFLHLTQSRSKSLLHYIYIPNNTCGIITLKPTNEASY